MKKVTSAKILGEKSCGWCLFFSPNLIKREKVTSGLTFTCTLLLAKHAYYCDKIHYSLVAIHHVARFIVTRFNGGLAHREEINDNNI